MQTTSEVEPLNPDERFCIQIGHAKKHQVTDFKLHLECILYPSIDYIIRKPLVGSDHLQQYVIGIKKSK